MYRQTNVRGGICPGPLTFPSLTSLSGYDGLVAVLGSLGTTDAQFPPFPASGPNGGNYPASLALPTSVSQRGLFLIDDGGLGGGQYPYQVAAYQIGPGRTYRALMAAVTCPTDTPLVLANPSTAITQFYDNLGVLLPMTTLAGFVTPLPAAGAGAILTPIVAGGVITGFTITAGGTGYIANQPLAVVDATGTGFAGYISTVSAAGGITGTAVVNGGTGYTAPQASVAPDGAQYWRVGYSLEAGVGTLGQFIEFTPDVGIVTQ
jgi:hypothetical protein